MACTLHQEVPPCTQYRPVSSENLQLSKAESFLKECQIHMVVFCQTLVLFGCYITFTSQQLSEMLNIQKLLTFLSSSMALHEKLKARMKTVKKTLNRRAPNFPMFCSFSEFRSDVDYFILTSHYLMERKSSSI